MLFLSITFYRNELDSILQKLQCVRDDFESFIHDLSSHFTALNHERYAYLFRDRLQLTIAN